MPVSLDDNAVISCPFAGHTRACHVPSTWSRTTEICGVFSSTFFWSRMLFFFSWKASFLINLSIVWIYDRQDTNLMIGEVRILAFIAACIVEQLSVGHRFIMCMQVHTLLEMQGYPLQMSQEQ